MESWLRGPALELTVFVPERGRPGRARRGGKAMRGAEVSCQRLLCRAAAIEVGDVGVQSCRSRVIKLQSAKPANHRED